MEVEYTVDDVLYVQHPTLDITHKGVTHDIMYFTKRKSNFSQCKNKSYIVPVTERNECMTIGTALKNQGTNSAPWERNSNFSRFLRRIRKVGIYIIYTLGALCPKLQTGVFGCHNGWLFPPEPSEH
jgi:hypothetical protein